MGAKTPMIVGQNFNLYEERLYEMVAGPRCDPPVRSFWSQELLFLCLIARCFELSWFEFKCGQIWKRQVGL